MAYKSQNNSAQYKFFNINPILYLQVSSSILLNTFVKTNECLGLSEKKSSRILNLNFEKIPLPLFHMGQSQGLDFLTRKYKILHLNVAQAAKEVRRLIESRHVMSQ